MSFKQQRIVAPGWNHLGILREHSDGIHPDFSKPYVRRFRTTAEIHLPDGKIAYPGDIIEFNGAADPRVNGRYTILAAAPGTRASAYDMLPEHMKGPTVKAIMDAVDHQDKKIMADIEKLLKDMPMKAAGMSRFDDDDTTPVQKAGPPNPNTPFPRMIMNANKPCYVCGRRPDRVPVALLERTKDDRIACCDHCATVVLGYEIHGDGHLTRKSTED